MSDFESALKDVMPSAMREVYLESPDVSWKDIGGLEEVKRELQEAVEWPMRYPDMQIRACHPKGHPARWTLWHRQDHACKSRSYRV